MMHFEMGLNTILEGIAVLGIGGIFRQLMILNGSVGRIKEWQVGHEKLDNERHNSIMALIERRKE